MKRLLLALIPVALLTTSTLAYPDFTTQPAAIAVSSGPGDIVAVTATSPATPAAAVPVLAQAAPTYPTTPAQPVVQQPAPQTPAQAPSAPEMVQEPLPLVVDTSALTEALSVLTRATAEAQLAITALDAESQQMHIQSAINLLAGSAAVQFKPTAAIAEGTLPGVGTLLHQALVAREDAEARWIAALDERDAQFYVAGPGGTLPPVTVTAKIGTTGLRPEEQAGLLVDRAILQAVQALQLASTPSAQRAIMHEDAFSGNSASDEAGQLLESVIKLLDSATKIVQIAINR